MDIVNIGDNNTGDSNSGDWNTIDPIQVNIGPDSGGNKLPEPSPKKLRKFIHALQAGGTKVNLKDNLYRIIGND